MVDNGDPLANLVRHAERHNLYELTTPGEDGPLAQLAEQQAFNLRVLGSNPRRPTPPASPT